MRITAIRHRSVPISSAISNAFISFSEMTLSAVAVLTDVVRDGRMVVGYGFNSNGRYAQSGILEVLEGSSLVLTGRTSRVLQTAWLQPGDKAAQLVTVVSNTFTTAKLQADGLNEIAMRWQDNLGLTNTLPWKLAIQTKKDAPPDADEWKEATDKLHLLER